MGIDESDDNRVTVSELIEELRKYPADMRVVTPIGRDDYKDAIPHIHSAFFMKELGFYSDYPPHTFEAEEVKVLRFRGNCI